MAQNFRMKSVTIKSDTVDTSGLVLDNLSGATPVDQDAISLGYNPISKEVSVLPNTCQRDTITQPQADTLTLEKLRVSVCGT